MGQGEEQGVKEVLRHLWRVAAPFQVKCISPLLAHGRIREEPNGDGINGGGRIIQKNMLVHRGLSRRGTGSLSKSTVARDFVAAK